jgi:hypothetical protein
MTIAKTPASGGRSRWRSDHAEVCRGHADLVAVYESRDGRFGLLLRQTLVPLQEERPEWSDATRRAARGVVQGLRAAGLRGGFLVLQWCQMRDVAAILSTWTLRFDADPERREQIARAVARWLADRRFIRSRMSVLDAERPSGGPGAGQQPDEGRMESVGAPARGTP